MKTSIIQYAYPTHIITDYWRFE